MLVKVHIKVLREATQKNEDELTRVEMIKEMKGITIPNLK